MKRARWRSTRTAELGASCGRPPARPSAERGAGRGATWPTSAARAIVIALFSLMAVRLGADFVADRPAHRAAAARQRGAGRRADGVRRVAGDGRSQHARAGPDGASRCSDRRWSARPSVDGARAGARLTVRVSAVGLLRRDRRQDVARPQLRPDAGQPRHRVDRALPVRPPSDLPRLSRHPRRRSSPPTRRCGTCCCWWPPTRRCWRARSARSRRWRRTTPIARISRWSAGASCPGLF